MAIPHWKLIRISLLAVTLGGILWVLGKSVLQPNVDEPPVNSFVFPTAVPLPDWQQVESAPLKTSKANFLAGQRYQYRRDSVLLDIEMRYVNYTDGNVSRLLGVYTPVKSTTVDPTISHQEGVGFYSVFVYQGRAYLSACINSRGGSTATEQQFVQNRYSYDLQFGRILLWALGQKDILDRRCLWSLLSTPVGAQLKSAPKEPKEAFQVLETAWFSWYRWWQPNFPPS